MLDRVPNTPAIVVDKKTSKLRRGNIKFEILQIFGVAINCF